MPHFRTFAEIAFDVLNRALLFVALRVGVAPNVASQSATLGVYFAMFSRISAVAFALWLVGRVQSTFALFAFEAAARILHVALLPT